VTPRSRRRQRRLVDALVRITFLTALSGVMLLALPYLQGVAS
jgi:hypothetical protein